MTDPVFDISGRVAVITGACGLIGRTLVQTFQERGATVVAVDVAAADPVGFASKIGGRAIGEICDVSDAAQVATLVRNVVDRCGTVDILLNNHNHKPTGFATATAEDFPEALWDAVMDVNLKGTFLTCRDFGRVMLQQGKGSIVNFASTYGVVSSNPALYEGNSLGNPIAYSASKGGIIMLSKYLGAYWAARGVRVNCVTPHGVLNNHESGFINRFSAMSPMKRLMNVSEVVGAVLFLASDASSYATGSNLLIEGGWTAW
jgi:NAD(P)-dependent dehydrogenase (short-subunit alcohol dehydrogenase family)